MSLFKKSQPQINPVPIASIVAAGATYRVSSYSDATHLMQLRQEWQRKAYDIYDTEGHLYYATNYVGSALSRIKLVAAERPKDDGQINLPKIITSGPVHKAVRAIQSESGGQAGLLRQLGRNIFLAGEAWLVAETSRDLGGGTSQTWAAVSTEELSVMGDSKVFSRRRLPGAQPQPLPEGSVTIRIWKEHPRYGDLADAGTRSCMELLEKIVTLNRAEKAVARSQMAGSGILALPMELVPPGWQNQTDNANPMESNPLWLGLADSMMGPLKDELHPSAVVPFLLVGPGEVIKNIKYEPLHRTFDSDAAQKSIAMAIEQIANTLELPKEILLGTGEATHWTAWAIREDVFQAHIQPLIEMICEALTRKYLTKALNKFSVEDLRKAGIENPDDVMVWYDASQLVIRPDKGDKAIALHDRFAISDHSLRREAGFGDSDAPDEDEKAKRIGIKMADPGMALSGKPTPLPPPAPGTAVKGKGGGGPLP